MKLESAVIILENVVNARKLAFETNKQNLEKSS
jgi:hypothetical protein